MSLSHETVLELMALADGELEGEEKARAERAVAESDEARRLVAGFQARHVAEWLVASAEERAVAADGIADAVMAKVVRQGAEGGGVVRLAEARGPGRRAGVAAPAAFAALALAAGIAMVLRGGDREVEERAPVASVAIPPVAEDVPSASALAQHSPAPLLGVEVDEIDSPSRDVSVFEIPVGTAAAAAANAGQPSSVVIMIEDDPGLK
jgi:anti-sigma factor RsiW